MSYTIVNKILEDLKFTDLYQLKFQDQHLSDEVMSIICDDEKLKEEMRQIVPSLGHRVSIINAFKVKTQVTKQ
ncbi:unnamed protein product, partial [Allacma fusca]